MKILNWIICVLVLLAAIGSAVLSFLLFQKREQMLNGWDQMAATIRNTAAALDAGSGTKVADALRKEKLDHKLSTIDLKENLAELDKAAKKVVEQRDRLADQLVAVARTVEVGDLPPADALKNIDSSEANRVLILKGAENVRKRNDGILDSFVSCGRLLGVTSVSVSDLKKPDRRKTFSEKITDAVNGKNRRISTYEGELTSISEHVDGEFKATEEAYRTTAQGVTKKVRKLASDFDENKKALKRVEADLASTKKSVDKAERANADLQNKIKRLDKEIANLRYKLNPTNNPIIDDYINDRIRERDLYALVRGKICKIDSTWGIAVVDIGRRYDVRRVVAGKELSNIVMMRDGVPMTVIRNDTGAKSDYIGKIRITGVFDNYCVASADKKDLKSEIREGDTVLFNKDDLDQLLLKGASSRK